MANMSIFDKLRTINIEGKTILLTHNDLDGSGPVVILRTLFSAPEIDLEVRHNSNGVMSYNIKDVVVNHGDEYDNIIVTDISMNDTDLEEIKNSAYVDKLVLIDHHISASHLNEYDWAVVEPGLIEDDFRAHYYKDLDPALPRSSSATSLFYDYLVAKGLVYDHNPDLELFVHQVATWDTWDWNNTFNRDMQYYTLNETFRIYGIDIFDRIYPERFLSPEKNAEFIRQTELLLEIENSKINSLLMRVSSSFKTGYLNCNGKRYSFCLWMGSSYMSEVNDLMKEKHPGKDLYLINYGTGIGVRSENPDINVGEFAKQFGGGGHVGAGGFKISEDMQIGYTQSAMNATFEIDK